MYIKQAWCKRSSFNDKVKLFIPFIYVIIAYCKFSIFFEIQIVITDLWKSYLHTTGSEFCSVIATVIILRSPTTSWGKYLHIHAPK